MKPKIYIETSVVSYLTSQPSRDIVTAARQQITREWWERRRDQYELFMSEFVVREARRGNPKLVELRLEVLNGLREVKLTEEATALGGDLIRKGPLPQKAAIDALHIAAAVSGGMHYLLTWNFKHLANAAIRSAIERICRVHGYEPCIICTPEELLED